VNRRKLKFKNFKHALRPGLALGLNRSMKDSSPCLELLNQCGYLWEQTQINIEREMCPWAISKYFGD
jgi:hypothetical protein